MKNIIIKIINRYLLKPIKVNYCSQTIYQALLGCLRLWEATKDDRWKERSTKLCDILMKIQQPDGGFDIGYDFNFGRLHKKGESTSPELVGLLALMEYYKIFGGEEVASAAHRAASWVKLNSMNMGDDRWAIPYAPHSVNEVMVYNGTSFAAGALGVYLSEFPDEELTTIYHGMNSYLFYVMSSSISPGKFWYYSDQTRPDLTAFAKNKVDYYHQMQQVEIHALAELNFSSFYQEEMILSAAAHVAFIQDDNGVVPYYNTDSNIHLWGYCSCASGFIMASKFGSVKGSEYLERARKIIKWITDYSWNGEYFYPILSKRGMVKDNRFYVRSDAWVFNTFALAIKEGLLNESNNICEKNYLKMEGVNFSGIENHASNYRIRLVNKTINYILKVAKSWQK